MVIISQTSLVFGELQHLRSTSQVFCRIFFNLALSDIPPVVRHGL